MAHAQKKILILDQDQELSGILSRRLELNGFKVFTAGDGDQGVSLTREHKPDLVILDAKLPDFTGKKAVSAFGLGGVPILFLKDMFTKSSGLEDGVVVDGKLYPTLQKPFYSGDLVEMVKGMLEKSNQQG